MSQTTNAEYQKLLKEQHEKVQNSVILDQLSLNEMTNSILENLYKEMNQITKKPVYEDYSYKSGKVLGLLRHIQQNPKHRVTLLQKTNLNVSILDLYSRSFGQLPYVKNGKVTKARQQDCKTLKELLFIVADKLQIVLTEYDVDDITEEHFNKLLEKAEAEMQANKDFSITTVVKDANTSSNIVYDE